MQPETHSLIYDLCWSFLNLWSLRWLRSNVVIFVKNQEQGMDRLKENLGIVTFVATPLKGRFVVFLNGFL